MQALAPYAQDCGIHLSNATCLTEPRKGKPDQEQLCCKVRNR